MKSFSLTFYAPYNFANIKGIAVDIEDANKQIQNHMAVNYYSIAHREIKTEKFDGKKASFNF